MPGKFQYDVEIKTNVAKLLENMKEVQDRLDAVEGKEYKIKLNVDEKKLSSVISNLEKMLDSLGGGAGDFKQFENLSKQLESITSDVRNFSKAFSKIDDSGAKTLLSSIQNIDRSLSELSQNILNVNKNMGNTGGAVKQVENIGNAYQNAAKEAEKLADAQNKIGQKTNISSAIEQQNKLQEELKETRQQAEKTRQSISELVKGRDVVNQNWYREKGTVVGKDSRGNDITRDTDEFSFVERLKNGQLQTVLATYDEETGKWTEQVINVRTAFEQVEKAIISADNKIVSLEMTKEKTLAVHPGYDTTGDDNQIAIEQKKRNELQKTLDFYAQEKEYVFEIEASNKRIAENLQRLQNKSLSQNNLQSAKENEAIDEELQKEIESLKKANRKKWSDFQKEQSDYEDSINEVNTAIQKTDELLNKLPLHKKLDNQFMDMLDSVDKLNSKLNSGELALSEYNSEIKSVTSEYSKMISFQNKADVTTQRFQNDFDKYSADINRKDYKPSTAFANTVSQYKSNIEDLKVFVEDLSKTNIINQAQIDSFELLIQNAEKTKKALKSMSAVEKGSTATSRLKLMNRIGDYMNRNTAMSKEFRNELQGLYDQLKDGDSSIDFGHTIKEFERIKGEIHSAGQEGKRFWDVVKERAWSGAAQVLGTYFGINDLIRYFKEGVGVVRELNTALTEMRKVSDETEQSLRKYQKTTFDTADDVGTTAKQIQNSTADWQRLGYGLEESAALAKNSNIYKNVGDMEIDEATEHMISSVQAWKSEFGGAVETSEAIMNRYNKIGNEFAISSADIGDAMERSAAALKAGGNNLNESLGILTAGNVIQQDASTTASAMKILSLRIRGRFLPPYMATYMLCY